MTQPFVEVLGKSNKKAIPPTIEQYRSNLLLLCERELTQQQPSFPLEACCGHLWAFAKKQQQLLCVRSLTVTSEYLDNTLGEYVRDNTSLRRLEVPIAQSYAFLQPMLVEDESGAVHPSTRLWRKLF